jgi:type VII secretion protein EccE
MLVLVSARQPWPVVVSASAGALVLVALTSVRLRGHWLYELAALGSAYLVRTRRHVLPADEGKALALLRLLLPGSATSTVETGHGPIMAVSHPRGMTAILHPQEVTAAVIASFPTPAELLPDTDGQPGELGIQTVFHAGARPGAPKLWVAVHAERTVATPLDEELTLVLRNALRRVRRALARAGKPTEPLAQDTAYATVTALAHIDGGRHEVREDWRFWRTGAVSQACFTLDGLEELGERELRRLVSLLLGRTPGVAVTVTLNALSGNDGLRVSAVLRLAAATEAAVEAAAGHIARPLSPLGIHLTRLDGTQLSGVAASLPLGGFLR